MLCPANRMPGEKYKSTYTFPYMLFAHNGTVLSPKDGTAISMHLINCIMWSITLGWIFNFNAVLCIKYPGPNVSVLVVADNNIWALRHRKWVNPFPALSSGGIDICAWLIKHLNSLAFATCVFINQPCGNCLRFCSKVIPSYATIWPSGFTWTPTKVQNGLIKLGQAPYFIKNRLQSGFPLENALKELVISLCGV